jgi:hypothetical protein
MIIKQARDYAKEIPNSIEVKILIKLLTETAQFDLRVFFRDTDCIKLLEILLIRQK